MTGLLIAMMVLVNLGGFASLLFSLRQGQLLAGLGTLLVMGLLDMFGFWLLKSMREDG
ncbi:hypothetical protein [Deinococcus sp.]|uniref:hypothetical protein n=1 Tax=Deinococcus sp. TaxID=47478 RepID=UPI003C7BE011